METPGSIELAMSSATQINALWADLNAAEVANARCRAETEVLVARIDALQCDLMRKTSENRLLREQLVSATIAQTPIVRGYASTPSSAGTDLQAKLDESYRVVLELRVQNNYWKSMVDTLQQQHHHHPQKTSGSSSTPGSASKKKDSATSSPSTATYALHTQSSLTKLKARSLDECHGRYLQAVSELKFICHDHITRGKGAVNSSCVGSSPSSAATNRLVTDILQVIDESTMNVDSMVNRLRRNNPGSDDSPLVGSPSSNGNLQGPTHHDGTGGNGRETYYESRYIATYAECIDLRRQMTTGKEVADLHRKSIESEIGRRYQQAIEVAEFEATEKVTAALMERDAAAEALQLAQQTRRYEEAQHAEALAALKEALHVAHGEVADTRTRAAQLEVDLTIAHEMASDLEASREDVHRRLEEERRRGAAWAERADALQSGLESATAAAQDAQVAYLRIDSESSHLRLELLRLRKLVATAT